jgi:hypothetical protein
MPIHDNGYYWFDLQTNEAYEQITRVNFDIKWNWGFRWIDTPEWVFMINKTWCWHIQEAWREVNVFRLLWQDFWDTVDASNADLVYDNNKDMLLATVDTTWNWVNDTVIWRAKIEVINERWEALAWWALWKYDLWSNTVLMADWLKTFWGDNDWSVYQLFSWTTDDWSDITSNFEQEIRLWSVNELHDLEQLIMKWFFSSWWDVDLDIDIYEDDGTKTSNKKQLTITMPWAWNSVETRIFKEVKIPNLQRIIIRLTSADQKAHKITYIQLATQSKGLNTKSQNLTTV